LSITGVEFVSRRNVGSPANPTVQIAVYSVDGANNPTALLGTQNVTVNTAAFAYYHINFASPISVSSNYAIVLRPTSTNAIIDAYFNDLTPGQVYDEGLSRFTSTYSGF